MLDPTIAEPLFLVGRILTGLFFVMMGINHFTQAKMMSEYAESKGIPAANIAVLGTGILLLFGGISLLSGFLVMYGLIALAIFFIGVTPMMHNFWSIEDEQMKMGEMTNFMKNIALLGFVLMFLLYTEDWPFAL